MGGEEGREGVVGGVGVEVCSCERAVAVVSPPPVWFRLCWVFVEMEEWEKKVQLEEWGREGVGAVGGGERWRKARERSWLEEEGGCSLAKRRSSLFLSLLNYPFLSPRLSLLFLLGWLLLLYSCGEMMKAKMRVRWRQWD